MKISFFAPDSNTQTTEAAQEKSEFSAGNFSNQVKGIVKMSNSDFINQLTEELQMQIKENYLLSPLDNETDPELLDSHVRVSVLHCRILLHVYYLSLNSAGCEAALFLIPGWLTERVK